MLRESNETLSFDFELEGGSLNLMGSAVKKSSNESHLSEKIWPQMSPSKSSSGSVHTEAPAIVSDVISSRRCYRRLSSPSSTLVWSNKIKTQGAPEKQRKPESTLSVEFEMASELEQLKKCFDAMELDCNDIESQDILKVRCQQLSL